MILPEDRKTVIEMVDLKIWKIEIQMRTPSVIATPDTRPLLKAMLERQEIDDLHHAPACPANHYHRCRLVFDKCTCGAAYYKWKDEQAIEREKRLESWTIDQIEQMVIEPILCKLPNENDGPKAMSRKLDIGA